jgi:hypothetical protein
MTILVRLMDWGCDWCGPWETKVQKLGVNKKFSHQINVAKNQKKERLERREPSAKKHCLPKRFPKN